MSVNKIFIKKNKFFSKIFTKRQKEYYENFIICVIIEEDSNGETYIARNSANSRGVSFHSLIGPVPKRQNFR
jgi:hypothetical protein